MSDSPSFWPEKETARRVGRAVAKKADRSVYDVSYSCRPEPIYRSLGLTVYIGRVGSSQLKVT